MYGIPYQNAMGNVFPLYPTATTAPQSLQQQQQPISFVPFPATLQQQLQQQQLHHMASTPQHQHQQQIMGGMQPMVTSTPTATYAWVPHNHQQPSPQQPSVTPMMVGTMGMPPPSSATTMFMAPTPTTTPSATVNKSSVGNNPPTVGCSSSSTHSNHNNNNNNNNGHHHWQRIVPSQLLNVATGQKSYAPGWKMSVYNADHTNYFRIPSESIMVTNGSQKYVQLYNSYGPHTKYRFQLCWESLTTGSCKFGDRCSFIHCTSTSMAGVQVTDVHYNTADPSHPQSRHPPGLTLRAYLPNSTTEYEDIASERIIQTQGSITALRRIRSVTSPTSTTTSSEDSSSTDMTQFVVPPPSLKGPQQCAHFFQSGVCTRGSNCHFIHVVMTDTSSSTPATSTQHEKQQSQSHEEEHDIITIKPPPPTPLSCHPDNAMITPVGADDGELKKHHHHQHSSSTDGGVGVALLNTIISDGDGPQQIDA